MSLIDRSRRDATRSRTKSTEELPSWAYDEKGAPLVVANGQEPVKPTTRTLAKTKDKTNRDKSRKAESSDTVEVRYLLVDQIKPNPFQPRRHFDEQELENLAESLREHGQLQPILVRPFKGGFQIIAGERRWRAAGHIPGFKLVCVIRPLNDMETLVASWRENYDRVSVRALDSAFFMVRFGMLSMGKGVEEIETAQKTGELPEDFPFEAVGEQTGMSGRSVRRYTDLLKLSSTLRIWFDKTASPTKKGDDKKAFVPTEKHGRALLLLRSDPKAQKQLIKAIEEASLSGDAAIAKAGTLKPINAETQGHKEPKAHADQSLDYLKRALAMLEKLHRDVQSGKVSRQVIKSLAPEIARIKELAQEYEQEVAPEMETLRRD